MEEMDIYVNIEPSNKHSKWKRDMKSSEDTYQRKDTSHALKSNRAESAISGLGERGTLKTRSCRAAAVILSLLSLLLLTGLLTLVFLHSKCSMEIIQLQTSYNNLTKEKDQLQTSYNNLTKEKDQLQTSYNNLTKEKDQLQSSYNNLAKDSHELREHKTMLQVLKSQGWSYFGGSLYYISSSEKSWEQSRSECKQKGADLVIINSQQEQAFIASFNKRIWIGLTDRATEGQWKWVDGTPLKTSYWATSEPNNERDEDCVEIWKFDSYKSWNDLQCTIERKWMCEYVLAQ